MKHLCIREFKDSDSEDYAKALLLTLPCDDIDEARQNVRIAKERAAQDTRELWVAEADGLGIGFMLLEFEEGTRNVEIDWLDVHPQYQRQGVGHELVLRAGERARAAHYMALTLHTASSNSRMREFARKHGFVESEIIPSFWGEGTEDAYLLLKRLD
jgi:ribosomal protein S18 acetylase RimI-like enzyme